MRFSEWHNETSWQGRSVVLGRWALLLAFAALPIRGQLVPLPLALGIVLLLPQVLAFGRLRGKALLLLPVVFYLLHVAGMAYSTDIDFGLFDLEVKLSLLLVPLVAAGLVVSHEKDFLRSAMTAFSIGLVVSMAISIQAALICYVANGWLECFTQSYLSAYLHPSYLAWFACWALFYWGRILIDGEMRSLRWRALCMIFMLLLLIYIVMLASKSGLIGLLIVAFALVRRAIRVLPRRNLVIVGGVLTLVVALPAAFLAPVLSARIGEAAKAVRAMIRSDETVMQTGSSTDERLIVWDCSVHCLRTSPWGAGTGDIKHALMACYQEKGADAAIQHNLNSHSQVLQSGVALGWPGLLLVCAIMLIPLVIGLRRRDPFLSIFALLFIVNGAIESVLEVQAGVVFFILFYVVLIRRSGQTRTRSIHTP